LFATTYEKPMTDDKEVNPTEEARTGSDADKNREELKKRAEKGIKDANGNLPKDEV